MKKACCATCEYWLPRYQQCEHPDQRACEAGEYEAPPDKLCELYEPNYVDGPEPGREGSPSE